MLPGNLPREVESVLHMVSSDIVHLEQYMDFLRNRMFRQTLICHDSVTPSYTLRPERLVNLYVWAQLRPARETPNLVSTEPEAFLGEGGMALKTAEPLLKTAMAYLGEIWPRAVRFSDLLGTARERLNLPAQPDKARQGIELCCSTIYCFSVARGLDLVSRASDRCASSTSQLSGVPFVSFVRRL